MKKVFTVLAIAGFLASCSNNAADAEKRTNDSLDSVKKAVVNNIESTKDKAKDSVDKIIDAKKDMNDSLHKDTDTTKSKM